MKDEDRPGEPKTYPGRPSWAAPVLISPSSRLTPAEMKLYPMTLLPGARGTTVIQSTVFFRADYLVLERSAPFRILDVKVGPHSQFQWKSIDEEPAGILPPRDCGSVAAAVFDQLAAARIPLRFDTMQPHVCLFIEVENVSPEEAIFAGKLVGWQVKTGL